MNRRQFFGMSAAAVALAGLPAIVLAERKFFLPPRGGWIERGLVMREIQQYLINDDSMPMRYDSAWMKDGHLAQFHVDFDSIPFSMSMHLAEYNRILEQYRAEARERLTQIQRAHGLDGCHSLLLPLPRTALGARYV